MEKLAAKFPKGQRVMIGELLHVLRHAAQPTITIRQLAKRSGLSVMKLKKAEQNRASNRPLTAEEATRAIEALRSIVNDRRKKGDVDGIETARRSRRARDVPEDQ